MPRENKSPKTVLRLGFGVFYDRFSSDLVLQQQLQNGVIQTQYLVANPTFFDPTQAVLPSQFPPTGTSPQTVYQINPNLRTPYTMQTGVTLERQLTKTANLSVTYLNSRGENQFYTKFLNPGTIVPPATTVPARARSVSIRIRRHLPPKSAHRKQQRSNRRHPEIFALLFGYYTLNYANSDTSGASYLPSNQTTLPGTMAARHLMYAIAFLWAAPSACRRAFE